MYGAGAPVLRQVPGFDPAFGRGYGEEVDWCLRVMALGGRHVAAPGLFVEHRAGSSFGEVEKQTLLRRNGAVLSQRYPGFDDEVQTALQVDSLVTVRLALGLGLAGARADGRLGGRVPVYLAYSMGGGAENYLRQRIAVDLAKDGAAVVLRVGGVQRWQIELHSAAGVTGGNTNDLALVERLLALLPARQVVYSCGVGDADPVELPVLLLRLGQGESHRIEVLFHDYFPLSPSYTLLDADGIFRGVPGPCSDDAAHRMGRVAFGRMARRMGAADAGGRGGGVLGK